MSEDKPREGSADRPKSPSEPKTMIGSGPRPGEYSLHKANASEKTTEGSVASKRPEPDAPRSRTPSVQNLSQMPNPPPKEGSGLLRPNDRTNANVITPSYDLDRRPTLQGLTPP